MKQSACSAVICQPGGREQKHDITIPGNGLSIMFFIERCHECVHLK